MSKKKSSLGGKFFKFLFMVILGFIVGIAITYFTNKQINFEGNPEAIKELVTNSISLAGAGVGALIGLVVMLNGKESDSSGGSNTGTTESGDEMKQYYSSRFVTIQELKKDKRFMYTLYTDLKNIKRDGIPLRAQRIGNNTHINMYKPIHTIVIGTTGSGKTTRIVDPTIQILSETKSHPSLVISDPKGELYNHNVVKLKKCGYDVQVVDLREPDKSSRWNPIERAYDNYQRAHNLVREIKIWKHTNPNNFPKLLKVPNVSYGDEWYEFDGVAYPDKTLLKSDLDALKEKLINSAQEDVSDIAATLCPIVGNDPSWPRGAQGLIKAIMLAMLEDSLIPELNMTKDKFNFYNLYKIASRRDTETNDNIVTLRNYFVGRDKTSECVDLANTVVTNAASTSKGYLGHVTGSLSMFSDTGICYLTSGTDIDFSHFADKPSALFIKVPDEKDTRHAIANIFITQLYKMLIERANENAKQGGEIELPRNVYFILDEFGNLPKIEKLKSFITAGRSRKIFLMLVIQDYTQLASIYGEQDASTIRNNCNIQIFIGTKDAKTREEFSKNAGNIALTMKNVSKTSSKDNTSTNTSSQTVQRQLITPDELDHLDNQNGEVIINCYGEFSIKSYFTPTYMNNQYLMSRPKAEYSPSKYLDKDKIFYDIQIRNNIILNNQPQQPNNMNGIGGGFGGFGGGSSDPFGGRR